MIIKNLKFTLYLVMAIWVSVSKAGSYEDFFKAVKADDAATVTQLLARGFDPNSPSEDGQQPLFLALRESSANVVGALLQARGVRVDAANAAGETALMMAALRGQLPWCARLIALGAAVNRIGWTPLHYAATGPQAQAAALLLEHGAQIDARSPNGSTALMMAARYGSEDAVALLLARGANARLRNEQDLGAADFARLGGREALAVKLEQSAK